MNCYILNLHLKEHSGEATFQKGTNIWEPSEDNEVVIISLMYRIYLGFYSITAAFILLESYIIMHV